MIIRCESCSTLYELDEKLLSPEGSQVQCTRCHAVFVARRPQAPRPAGQAAASAPEPAAAAP
ncbi:MAG TPA: zinc-ribbon domain-containing protein, partial [Anaeromyxobacteraceae bacterium]|nr:zinc-ribbon domain-containing protein [Anaeromyxobacteraceae bacterium]